jgi:hypothetical protein
MTDEIPTPDSASAPAPEPSAAAAPEAPPSTSPSPAADAWNDVLVRMGELATAVSAWAKTAVDDPQNRQRLAQMRAGVDEMARQADVAFGKVASSDFGQQVTQGAQQAGDAIGDAAQQVSTAAAPHVATALSGLAGFFGQAAAKMDEAVNRDRAAEASTPPPAAPESPATETTPPAQPEPDSEGQG